MLFYPTTRIFAPQLDFFMQKQILFYFFGLMITCLVAGCSGCQENGNGNGTGTTTNNNGGDIIENPDEELTQNGFRFVQHVKNEGPKPQVGEYAYFNLEIYGIPQSGIPMFFEAGEDFRKIVDPKEFSGFQTKNPMIDILPLLSVGDSVTIYQSPDSIINLAPTYGGLEMFEYKVTMTAIRTPPQHTEKQKEIFNKRKAKLLEARTRLETINAFCQKTLADFKANKLDNLIEKKSGLKYIVHEPGKGNNYRNRNTANFFYSGLLMDGTVFENTFESGNGTAVQVGRAESIPGWEEAMTYLKVGAKVTLFVPPHLAFGELGSPPQVPPNADVMFYMEFME